MFVCEFETPCSVVCGVFRLDRLFGWEVWECVGVRMWYHPQPPISESRSAVVAAGPLSLNAQNPPIGHDGKRPGAGGLDDCGALLCTH
jgi:hypothetical protein